VSLSLETLPSIQHPYLSLNTKSVGSTHDCLCSFAI